MMSQDSVERFRELEESLRDLYPDAVSEAKTLAGRIADPRTADADEVWIHAWNKPLYANTKVSIGTDAVRKLAPYMDDAWRYWGAENNAFRIEKVGKGSGTEAFKATTDFALKVREETGIAMHRLFAIQGAANALRAQADKSATPYACFVGVDIETTVRAVRQEMGPGWGHITVLHFLTDLGLACKPDLHLVRAVRHLGFPLDAQKQTVPSLANAVAINRWVRALVGALYGAFSPTKFRYLDKVLMEVSRRGLLAETRSPLGQT